MNNGMSRHAWLRNLLVENVLPEKQSLVPISMPDDLAKAWDVTMGILECSAEELVTIIANRFENEVAVVDKIDSKILSLIPERVARKNSVFPIREQDSELVIACATPFDDDLQHTLGFVSAHRISIAIASPNQLEDWITKYYSELGSKSSEDQETHRSSEATTMNRYGLRNSTTDSAIAKLVQQMLQEAEQMNTSDVHIEPFAGGGVIRYRIDGLLRRITTLPAPVFNHMVQRIKSISGMNVANRLIPQDGNATIEFDDLHLDLRVSVIPVSNGEKVVVRLLKQNSGTQSIDRIGLDEHTSSTIKKLLAQQSGIFLMTGPTGSGKTTTLYAMLKELNTVERCLVTVEDPVEYHVEGIAQVNVNPSQDVTFSNSLRAFLRQDPDVMLVGEIRDEETARITMRAALTGHLVFSTLHTRDSVTAISRLLDLSISPSILGDAINGLAAQRMLRKLCTNCAVPSAYNTEMHRRFQDLFGKTVLQSAVGCDRCEFSGYMGRIPLVELVVATERFSDAIRMTRPTSELRNIAVESGTTLMADLALEKIADGTTSIDEVHRVLGESFWIPRT